MKENSFLHKYKSIIGFLILEVLALVSFTFANINEVLYLVSTALSICAFLFAFFTNSDRKDFLKLLPIVGGLFIISGFAAFGGFSKSFSTLSNVAIFFAIPSFFSLGFFARRIDDIKPQWMLLAIGFGFALLTLIGMIGTWSQYGIFYKEIYKSTPMYFYNGTSYDLTSEMYWLTGFKFSEVTIEYGGMFALLSAVFLPAAIFIDRKAERNAFISSLVIGLIGVLSLISIPNWKALVFLVITSLFALVYKFLKERKLVVNILFYCVVGIVCLGTLYYLIAILNGAIGFKFTGVFDRLFANNFLMRAPSHVLTGAFAKDINGSLYNLTGFDLTNGASAIIDLNGIIQENTHIFEFEVIKEVGILGTVFVIGFFAAMFVFVYRYVKKSQDSSFMKNVVVMILVAFMLMATFGFSNKPECHISNSYQPFLRSVPFMISLCVLGYCYFVPQKKEKPIIEKTIEEATL